MIWKCPVTLTCVLLSVGCAAMTYDDTLSVPAAALRADIAPVASVTVREDRHEVEVVVGPFDIAPMDGEEQGHHHGSPKMRSPLAVFPWPVQGGLAGFRLAAWDAEGTPQPRDIFHHVIGLNFDRRQLVYPVAERLIGFGTETPDIRFPDFIEVPVQHGDSIGIYAMWNNSTGETLEDIYMQIVLPYSAPGRDREPALPIYVDTYNVIGQTNTFDLPPGKSDRAYEFELPVGGGLLAAGGHLHDYGQELRIEEAATGRVLFRLNPDLDSEGNVTGVEQRIFRRFFMLLDRRVRLESGVRYRIVGEYDNPTGRMIHDGGMAHIVGLFVPDDMDRWPRLDRANDLYRLDLTGLPERIEAYGRESP